MVVVMKPGASQRQIDHVIERIEQLGLRSHVIVGTERTVIAALGEKRDGAKQALETGEGVEKVVPILAPYKMASTEVKKDRTVVEVLGLKVGNGHVGVIAGPCSVESKEQILEVAHIVKEAGATALRGGAFKPRTSPYSFQGLKEKGLQLLAEARAETGLAVVTEVMAPEHVELVGKYADVLQVGARNMQNYPLLERVGESGLPVLLKRGPAATMDEFLLAAEYILKTGNTRVMLCEPRHPHVRGSCPLHAAAGHGALLAADNAPAGGGRSEPRHRQGEPGGDHGAGGGGGGRGRPHDRNPPRPGEGTQRRLPGTDAAGVPAVDGGVSQGRGGGRA